LFAWNDSFTTCTFGGPDRKTLYATTAATGAPPGDRLAGGLYAIHITVSGLPENRILCFQFISQKCINAVIVATGELAWISVCLLLDNLEALRSQKTKLEHAVERLIDSFAEGLIEKDQFASRMARTKSRIADLDSRVRAYAGDVDQREQLRVAMKRLRELAATIGPELGSADWQRRREIIRTVVSRIDIDTDVIKIIPTKPEHPRLRF
jgi:hypothetical protein